MSTFSFEELFFFTCAYKQPSPEDKKVDDVYCGLFMEEVIHGRPGSMDCVLCASDIGHKDDILHNIIPEAVLSSTLKMNYCSKYNRYKDIDV